MKSKRVKTAKIHNIDRSLSHEEALTALEGANKKFGIKINKNVFLNNPTMNNLNILVDKLLYDRIDLSTSGHTIKKAPVKSDYALSHAQKRLFMLHKLEPTMSAYNECQVHALSGNLNVAVMKKSIKALVGRHEALRTNFKIVKGQPRQTIKTSVALNFTEVDLSGIKDKKKQTEKKIKLIYSLSSKPFNLENGRLSRFILIKERGHKNIFVIIMHHIITDDKSMGIFYQELKFFYDAYINNQRLNLPKLTIQYKDYAEWEQSSAYKKRLQRQEKYWVNKLSSRLPMLRLPADKPSPSVRTLKGNTECVLVDKKNVKIIKEFCKKFNLTPFIFFLAVFNMFLYKISGQKELIIGTPTTTRNFSECQKIFGFFINTTIIKSSIDGNISFLEFLYNTKNKLLESFEYNDFPFDKLVEKLNPQRNINQTPIFNTMFQLVRQENRRLALPGIKASPGFFNRSVAKFDIKCSVIINEKCDHIMLTFDYSLELFYVRTIKRYLKIFLTLINEIIKDPHKKILEYEVLSDNEKKKLINDSKTKIKYPKNKTISRLFAEQVKKTPNKIALVSGDKKLNYLELNWAIDCLVQRLIKKKIDPGEIVAVMADKSVEFAVGILAVLGIGCAFLPIDPELPKNRIKHMLSDSKTKILLTQKHLKNKIKFSGNTVVIDVHNDRKSKFHNPKNINNATDLAYVMYTSGTTGKPKGVMISHRNIVNYNNWFTRTINITERDKSIFTSSFAFDAPYTQFFGSLLNGGELHIVPNEVYLSGSDFIKYIYKNKITYLKVTPSLLNILVNNINFKVTNLKYLRFVMVGGEEIIPKDIEKVIKKCRHIKIMNHYGPTETTIGSIAQFIDTKKFNSYKNKPTIGRPIDNTWVYILDKNLKLMPRGLPGELYIGGDGVGLGYWRNQKLTNEKFISDPFRRNNKLYRTGDLARWTDDGYMEYLGRIDDQIKIRGHRVEPKEIENQLVKYKKIKEVLVLAKIDSSTRLTRPEQTKSTEKYIRAYVVPKNKITITEIRDYLRRVLPAYMIPAHIIILKSFPLTKHNKINRDALPEPKIQTVVAKYAPPETETEKQLAQIWQEVLNIKKVPRCGNFFDLGGHSLKAIQALARINNQFKINLPLKEIFRYHKLSRLAGAIEDKIVENNIKINENN